VTRAWANQRVATTQRDDDDTASTKVVSLTPEKTPLAARLAHHLLEEHGEDAVELRVGTKCRERRLPSAFGAGDASAMPTRRKTFGGGRAGTNYEVKRAHPISQGRPRVEGEDKGRDEFAAHPYIPPACP